MNKLSTSGACFSRWWADIMQLGPRWTGAFDGLWLVSGLGGSDPVCGL